MSEILMINPATGKKIGTKKTMTEKQVLDAYKKASQKASSFRKKNISQRVNEISKIKR